MEAEWRVERDDGGHRRSHMPHLFDGITVCGALGIGYYYTREPTREELHCESCGSDLRCKKCLAIEKKMEADNEK